MQLQPQPIGRLMVVAASVGLLLVIFGRAVVLTAMADRPLAPVPVRAAGGQTLSGASTHAPSPAATHPAGSWTAPGRRWRVSGMRDHRRPQDQFSAQQATTITPVALDRSLDLRADLQDMAISIRWHRGAPSDLPPGSD